MPRTKLTVSDKSYIENHINNMTVEQIAEDIDCTVEMVQTYSGQIVEQQQEEQTEPAQEEVPQSPRKIDLAIKKQNAVAMTEALSERGDRARKRAAGKNKYREDCVFKPYGNSYDSEKNNR